MSSVILYIRKIRISFHKIKKYWSIKNLIKSFKVQKLRKIMFFKVKKIKEQYFNKFFLQFNLL